MESRSLNERRSLESAGNMEPALPWYWKRVNLFEGIEDDCCRAFFASTEKHEYVKGRHILFANDPGSRILYLSRGLVKIYSLSEYGEATIHWFCVPGEVFGMGGITCSPYQMIFAQSVEQSCVYAMTRPKFEEFIKTYPQLSLNVIKLMGARLRLACDTVSELASQRVDRRLARQLLRLAENCGHKKNGGIELRAHITHQEFANMIGSCRQTVTATLQDFRDRGLIDMVGRCIIILATDELRELGEGAQQPYMRMNIRVGSAVENAKAGRGRIAPTLARQSWRDR